MKKIRYFFVLVFVMLVLIKLPIQAEEKEYSVDSVDFDVELKSNGDAIITENWTVHYKNGDFTRFYKDINLEVSEMEKFSDIEIVSIKVNDIECSSNGNLDTREDFTYLVESNSSKYTYHIFKSCNKEYVNYNVKYILKDVVKETKDGYAMFVYRFVGKTFAKPINSCFTTIKAPNNNTIEVRYDGEANVDYLEDSIVLRESRQVNEVLKYKVVTDLSAFDGLTYTL